MLPEEFINKWQYKFMGFKPTQDEDREYVKSLFVEMIKDALSSLGISEHSMSRSFGVPVPTIERWKEGRTNPHPVLMPMIRKRLIEEAEILTKKVTINSEEVETLNQNQIDWWLEQLDDNSVISSVYSAKRMLATIIALKEKLNRKIT